MITIIAFLAGAALGATASYLALRNNPKVRAALDTTADQVDRLAKKG